MNLFKNVAVVNMVFLIVVISTVHAQTKKRSEKKLNKHQLETSLFDRNTYAKNFLWVDKNYLTNSFQSQLEKVSFYNELIKKVDTADVIKPIFFFKEDSITSIVFKKKGKVINIINDTSENGIIVYYRRIGSNSNKYYVKTGIWENGLREEKHYDYNPLDKPCLTIISYIKGKQTAREKINLKE